MMRSILFFFMMVAFIAQVYGQQLHTTRRTVIFNSTADWCPPCGEWGWLLNDSLEKIRKTDTSFRAYPISIHSESHQTFLNSTIAEILEALAKPGPIMDFPSYMVDNLDMVDVVDWIDFNFQFNNTDTIDRAIDSLKHYVALETAAPAVAAIGLDAWQTPDSLYVRPRVRFQQNTSGDYRLAVYVVEDSVLGTQTSMSGTVHHHMVLREPMETTTFGYTLPGGPFTMNQEFSYTYKMLLPTSWNKSRLHYMAILYKVDIPNASAEIENVYMTNQLLTPSNPPTSIGEVSSSDKMEVYPNPVKDHINIRLKTSGTSIIQLTDMNGRKLATLFQGTIAAGATTTVAMPVGLGSGIYLLKATTPAGIFHTRISIW